MSVKMSHIGKEYGQNTSIKAWTILTLELIFKVDLGLVHF